MLYSQDNVYTFLLMFLTGRFNVKNVVASISGEPSKLKVKVRVTNHGVFGIMNAYIVEKTIVEEPQAVPEPAPVATTNGQAEGQGETKEEGKQTGEQPSQDSQQQQGAPSSDKPASKGDQDSSSTPSAEQGQQQQQEEAMDTGNGGQKSQQVSGEEKVCMLFIKVCSLRAKVYIIQAWAFMCTVIVWHVVICAL